jgi:hypothetical protein
MTWVGQPGWVGDHERVGQSRPGHPAGDEQVLRDKRSAQTEQLATALAAGFTPVEVEILSAAAPLIERLGESL